MNVQKTLLAIGLISISTTLVADLTQIRPGRWQVTMQMDFPGGKLPEGMGLSEPTTSIACVTAEDLAKWGSPVPLFEEQGCKVTNLSTAAREYSYTVRCEDAVFDLKTIVHSPDSYSTISRSHGQDPTQDLVMKISGKRVGEACSAKELAEQKQELEESDE